MQISEELNTIVGYAKEEAMRTGNYQITPDHLLLGILRHGHNTACRILEGLDANLSNIKKSIEERIFARNSVPYTEEDSIRLGRDAQNSLNLAVYEAAAEAGRDADSVHLLLALCRCRCFGQAILESMDIDAGAIKAYCHDHGIGGQAPSPATATGKKDSRPANGPRILGTISIRPSDICS